MSAARSSRLRRLAIVLVFALGVVATMADEPVMPPSVDLGSAKATAHLDAANPTSMIRLVARFSPEATNGARPSLAIRAYGVVTGDSSGSREVDVPDGVRLVAIAASPDLAGVATSSPGPSASTWQAEVSTARPASPKIDCGAGPCEREFWLIAELTDALLGPVDIDWWVSADTNYLQVGDYPSGATASLVFDPAVQVAGPAPTIATSTPIEKLSLSPEAPSAARVVEVTVGAGAIPRGGGPAALVEVFVDGLPPDDVSISLRGLLVRLTPLGASPGAGSPTPGRTLPSAAPLGDGPSPTAQSSPSSSPTPAAFANCTPGEPCTRRFLVTFAYEADKGVPIDVTWQLNVRRVDVTAVWTEPADLSARVTHRYDVDPAAPPATLHLEGDLAGTTGASPPEARVAVQTASVSADPIAPLLPVPAAMTISAQLTGAAAPSQSEGSWDLGVEVHETGSPVWLIRSSEDSLSGTWQGTGNPMVGPAGCLIGTTCPALSITPNLFWRGSASQPAGIPSVHWSMDLRVYSYSEIPITVTAQQAAP